MKDKNVPVKNTFVERRVYGGKSVFVFEDHAVALKPWALMRAELSAAPLLLTLDYHTDTRPAFGAAAWKAGGMDGWHQCARAFLAAIRYKDAGTLEQAVGLLKNDEHILAAIGAGIIDAALVLPANGCDVTRSQEWEGTRLKVVGGGAKPPPRPHHYSIPPNRVFYLPSDDAIRQP